MQNKFSANLPQLPPSPMLPTLVGSPMPTPLPSPRHEKSAWFASSTSSSPRSSLSSSTSHPVRLDDYKYARHAQQPAPAGGILGFGVRQLLQRRGRWALLLLLLATSAFLFMCAPSYHDFRITPLSSDAPRADPVVPIPGSGAARKGPHRGGSWRRPVHKTAVLNLGLSEELAVLTAYLAALPENRIPNVDPATPLDPQLVVDFDTRSATAKDELAEVVHDVWHRNPVVLFGKVRSCPVCRFESKQLIIIPRCSFRIRAKFGRWSRSSTSCRARPCSTSTSARTRTCSSRSSSA
jgi:hypothetical protein